VNGLQIQHHGNRTNTLFNIIEWWLTSKKKKSFQVYIKLFHSTSFAPNPLSVIPKGQEAEPPASPQRGVRALLCLIIIQDGTPAQVSLTESVCVWVLFFLFSCEKIKSWLNAAF